VREGEVERGEGDLVLTKVQVAGRDQCSQQQQPTRQIHAAMEEKQREVEREWETTAREGESESRGGEEKGPSCLVSVLKKEERVRGQWSVQGEWEEE